VPHRGTKRLGAPYNLSYMATDGRRLTRNLCAPPQPNRNWAFEWGGAGTSDQPCSDSYQVSHSQPRAQGVSVCSTKPLGDFSSVSPAKNYLSDRLLSSSFLFGAAVAVQGASAASEVEVSQVQNYICNNNNTISGYINFHSYSQVRTKLELMSRLSITLVTPAVGLTIAPSAFVQLCTST
jgi:hypothetical protein